MPAKLVVGPQEEARKVCTQTFPSRLRLGDGDFCLLSAGSLGNFSCTQRIDSLFAILLWVSWTQVPLAFRDKYVRACPLSGNHKRWTVQTLRSSWRVQRLEVPSRLYGTVLGMWFMMRVYLSLPYSFHCRYFLICLSVGVTTQLVSGFLSVRIAVCLAVHLVSPQQERSSGAFCVVFLVS